MTVLPVIGRELRTQARMTLTYHLRMLGALAVLLVCSLYSFNHPLVHARGGELFALLNFTLFFSIWALVPLLCADCISRERREGTIGLLFLTPLHARDIVLAKGLVHGLRAFSLLLTTLPVITIAILIGGVTWTDAVLSLTMNFSAMCWALAAGLIASSLSKSWVRSQFIAFILTGGLGFIFVLAVGYNFVWHLGALRPPPFMPTDFDDILVTGYWGATDRDACWGEILGLLPPTAVKTLLLAQGWFVGLSILVLLAGVEIASQNLKRLWREQPKSARRAWLEGKLFMPILMVALLRRWLRRKLDRNPIGWLEYRNWSGRIVTWGWFATMVSIFAAVINQSDPGPSLDGFELLMAWSLLSVITVTAAGSFRRERETGVLELLLVSPMSVEQIIGGRLRGLWGQFLPAFIVLLGLWAYLSNIYRDIEVNSGLIQFFCNSFMTLPVIGLYYSLRRSNFIGSLLFTALMGAALPWLAASICSVLLERDTLYSIAILLQWIIAIAAGRRLYIDLKRRNFPLTRAIT